MIYHPTLSGGVPPERVHGTWEMCKLSLRECGTGKQYRIMACVPCVVWPILLFIWYKFIHPFFLKFWDSKKICNEKVNLTSEGGENENNVKKCYSDMMDSEQIRAESMKKDE